jgi:hypothetical protein
VLLLPGAWQYPEYTVARISFMDQIYVSGEFQESKWRMVQDFDTIEDERGQLKFIIPKNSGWKMKVLF